MKIKLFVVGLFLTVLTFGQTQINLKSGEKIEGEVKSLVNGVLTVNFKENNLTLKQSDIESIFFVKQSNSTPTSNNKAELRGVVTYYFNKNYGDNPDIGARIYLRKTDTTNRKASLIQKYGRAKVCRSLIGYKTEVESCTRLLKELNADTKEGFDKMNTDMIGELVNLDDSKDVTKVTADGNGNYSVSVEPGLYEIIFISKGRPDMTVAEINGKIDTKVLYLKSGDTKVIDKRFEL